tara:strand:- start:61122 stop:61340 length:219 start_codon:yes stop_codon:yes gene_type:complete
MKKLHHLLGKITQLTTEIETKYPELYQFLDENPITIPSVAHPDLDKKILEEYLEDLNELLEHHLQTHKAKAL